MVPLLIVVRAGLDLDRRLGTSSMTASGPTGALASPMPSSNKTEVSVTRFQESRLDYAMDALPMKATGSLNSNMDV